MEGNTDGFRWATRNNLEITDAKVMRCDEEMAVNGELSACPSKVVETKSHFLICGNLGLEGIPPDLVVIENAGGGQVSGPNRRESAAVLLFNHLAGK